MTNDRRRVKFNVDKENKQDQPEREKERTEQIEGISTNQPISICGFFYQVFSFFQFSLKIYVY